MGENCGYISKMDHGRLQARIRGSLNSMKAWRTEAKIEHCTRASV